MAKASLSILFSLLLTIGLALGKVPPVQAQPLSIASFNSGGASLFSFSGKRPSTLGVKGGKLSACPTSPNCVSSQSPETDKQHSIAPLAYKSNPEQAMVHLKSVVQGMERTKLITDQKDYIHAEFATALMGFVDDVEFYLDSKAGVIQVRSASRLGQSDLGVNRKRIEEIRAKFAKLEGIA
jgi:uncharacterized protein (DUF1499 family)